MKLIDFLVGLKYFGVVVGAVAIFFGIIYLLTIAPPWATIAVIISLIFVCCVIFASLERTGK